MIHALSEQLKFNNFPKSPNVFEAFPVSLAESVLLVSVCSELFECYVCMLLSYLSVLAVICLRTGLLHLSTCSLRMKAFPVCLCHLLFNQVLCTQKMLSTQELAAEVSPGPSAS